MQLEASKNTKNGPKTPFGTAIILVRCPSALVTSIDMTASTAPTRRIPVHSSLLEPQSEVEVGGAMAELVHWERHSAC